MEVFMLGWEYPPHISGGLGTACEGLTKGLARLGIKVNFVVPRLTGEEVSNHMNLVDPFINVDSKTFSTASKPSYQQFLENIKHHGIPSSLSPYWNEETFQEYVKESWIEAGFEQPIVVNGRKVQPVVPERTLYSSNIFDEVNLYAFNVSERMPSKNFDVIHMHDWMTYPAGVRVAKKIKKPLIAHVHSLEFDRSGANGNSHICDIERYGLEQADKIIAVSHYTSELIEREYKISPSKIKIVHNGVYPHKVKKKYKRQHCLSSKVVLFLGRITFQKGPDYFVEAAAKVIPRVPEVMFVMAGAGDMLDRLKARVAELNIQDHFKFPGFLKGAQVEQAFSSADLYVMPSVSEPFGIAPLEAASFNTPVIISRQSGVSEVLSHALKTDFWDVERMADLMINGLLYKELRADLSGMAKEELKSLRWDVAAHKVKDIYSSIVGNAS